MADNLFSIPPHEDVGVEEQMSALINKYSGHFESHVSLVNAADGEYVVVTDPTSNLGAHLVAQLVGMEQVRAVFCLVRATSVYTALFRVQSSLLERDLWYDISVEDGKKIIALPADLCNPHRLGMSEDAYNQLREFATSIIHCGWINDFRAPLANFEGCIASTRRLLDLCLEIERPQPARFYFCSSVSAVGQTPGQFAPEALPDSFACAEKTGYAQSKLVAEHVVHRAGQSTELHTCVVRLQQNQENQNLSITGDNGTVAAILRTGKSTNALPSLDAIVRFDRVDITATGIIELVLSSDVTGVLNVVHPILCHWTYCLLPLLNRAGPQLQTVSLEEWRNRLQKLPSRHNLMAGRRFANLSRIDLHPRQLTYDTKKAQSGAPVLRQTHRLDEQAIGRLLANLGEFSPARGVLLSLKPRTVFIVAGPCGCGKSTTARALAQRFELPMIEGDDIHAPASRRKMAQKIPLTDDDRWGWLAHLRGAVMDRLQNSEASGVVVTCSALRTVYRDQLRHLTRLFEDPVRVAFLMLSIRDSEQLQDRLEKRSSAEGHYMSPTMVHSQLQVFEDPEPSEKDVIVINADQPRQMVWNDVEEVVNDILALE